MTNTLPVVLPALPSVPVAASFATIDTSVLLLPLVFVVALVVGVLLERAHGARSRIRVPRAFQVFRGPTHGRVRVCARRLPRVRAIDLAGRAYLGTQPGRATWLSKLEVSLELPTSVQFGVRRKNMNGLGFTTRSVR